MRSEIGKTYQYLFVELIQPVPVQQEPPDIEAQPDHKLKLSAENTRITRFVPLTCAAWDAI